MLKDAYGKPWHMMLAIMKHTKSNKLSIHIILAVSHVNPLFRHSCQTMSIFSRAVLIGIINNKSHVSFRLSSPTKILPNVILLRT
jgi:hypothetical protein